MKHDYHTDPIANKRQRSPCAQSQGMVLFALKRYQEALAAYEQAIQLNPNDALFHYNKEEALRYLGKPKNVLHP